MDGRVVQKETLNITLQDTLVIKFKHNDYFSKDIYDRTEFKITTDSTNNNIIYSNEVRFRIKKSNENYSYIQIEKEAKGESFAEARQNADRIRYDYKIIGNQLIFDNYLLTDLKNKYRNQHVEISLFLTEGTIFKVEESAQDYDRSDDDFFDLNYDAYEPAYKVGHTEAKCLNCPDEENESEESEEQNLITDTVINNNTSIKELKINKDGIIIKTK